MIYLVFFIIMFGNIICILSVVIVFISILKIFLVSVFFKLDGKFELYL